MTPAEEIHKLRAELADWKQHTDTGVQHMKDSMNTCAQLRAELERVKAERDEAKADVETHARFAEKFGDLSGCYDAEDVTMVVDRAFEDKNDQLSAQAAETARLREALEITKSSTCIVDCDCIVARTLALPATSAEARYQEEQERVRRLVKALEANDWSEPGISDEISEALAAFQTGESKALR